MLFPMPVEVGHLREELPTSFELALEMLLLVMNPIMLFERVQEGERLATDTTAEHSVSLLSFVDPLMSFE